MSNHLKVNDDLTTDDWLAVDGYLFLFDGKDLTGEYFTPDTNSESSYTKTIGRLAIDAEHEFKLTDDYPGEEALGYVDAATIRDDKYGRLARHLLDRRNKYVEFVFEPLIRAKMLGSSTQAIPEGVVKSEDGKIDAWPLRKQALTVEPAETRLLSEHQLQVIKSIINNYPALKSILIDAKDSVTEPETSDIDKSIGDIQMSEKDTDTIIVNDEYQKGVNSRFDKLEATLEKVVDVLEKIPAKSTPIVVEDETDKKVNASPHQFGMRMQAIRYKTLNLDLSKEHKAILGQNESIPDDGAYLVGTDQSTELEKKIYDSSVFVSRAQQRTITSGANSMDFYGVKENSRADGSRHGGVRVYKVAEGGTITPSQMEFYKYTLKPEKYAALVYATDEVMNDAGVLQQEINSSVPLEMAFELDNDMLRGSSAGYPQGILNAPSLVTVAKEGGQAASTIVSENIINMWARRWVRGNYVWFVNQDVTPQLHQLNLPVGTGGALTYMPPGGLSAAPHGTLYGRPVVETEFNSTLGTVGDIALVDWNQYKLANVGGLQTASSIHVAFVTDQMAWRFTNRWDGQLTWQAALTPFQGTNTVSPAIVLATRA